MRGSQISNLAGFMNPFRLLCAFLCSFVLNAASQEVPLLPDPLEPPVPPSYTRPVEIPVTVEKKESKREPRVFLRPGSRSPATALSWDALEKTHAAQPGEEHANISFQFTNTTEQAVTIQSVRTSCGCTVAKLPDLPWSVDPGETSTLDVTVDLRGKRGRLTKMVYVNVEGRFQPLTVKIDIPQDAAGGRMMNRSKNIQLALADRQAIFKGECAQCHVKPARGKMGKELYAKACGICHEAEHRASMVPDLHHLEHPTSRDYWLQWVRKGKTGTLMPGFAQEEGGPLTDQQIESLVDFLVEHLPDDAKHAKASGAPVP